MAQSSLGGVSGNGICIAVRSLEASNTIPLGAVVVLTTGTTSPNNIGAEQITIDVSRAGTGGNLTRHCGIATAPIPAGYNGTIIVAGATLAMTSAAALTYAVGLQVDTASPYYGLIAHTGANRNIGVSLEANHTIATAVDYGSNTAKYVYAWVNFMTQVATTAGFNSFGYT